MVCLPMTAMPIAAQSACTHCLSCQLMSGQVLDLAPRPCRLSASPPPLSSSSPSSVPFPIRHVENPHEHIRVLLLGDWERITNEAAWLLDVSMAAQGLLLGGSLDLQKSPLFIQECILRKGCWGLRRMKSQLIEAA